MPKKYHNKKQVYRQSLQRPMYNWEQDEYVPTPQPTVRVRRKSRLPHLLLSLALVALMIVTGLYAAYDMLGGYFQTGEFGTLDTDEEYVPKPYGDEVVHILMLGIDYEEGRNYQDGLGLTDLVLYARYDLVNNSLNLLQIPRDSYIGDEASNGGTGKINELLMHGPDKENPINNVASEIERQFQLPVDHYITLDMDALKTIIDTLGGIEVYVPQEMYYNGSYLAQGWQWMGGDAAEFFVRNRSGEGFERADIDRLDNQRHFYSALFRRLLDMAPQDIVNLMPVFAHYCNTSLQLNDLIDLAYSALNLTPENVMFCKAPGATGPALDPTGQNRSNYYIDLYGRGTEEDPGLAALLNEYFRDPDAPVSAEELLLPQIRIPESYTLYPPNVQSMGAVQAPEDGVVASEASQAA